MFFRDLETFTQEVPGCDGLSSYQKIPFPLMRFDTNTIIQVIST